MLTHFSDKTILFLSAYSSDSLHAQSKKPQESYLFSSIQFNVNFHHVFTFEYWYSKKSISHYSFP